MKFWKNKKNKIGDSVGERSKPELRMDMVSSEWAIMAEGRFKKPDFINHKSKETVQDRLICPFCDIKETPIITLTKSRKSAVNKLSDEWTVMVVPNKFPIVSSDFNDLGEKTENEFYKSMNAVGFHELVVFRDHQKNIWDMNDSEINEIFDAYILRYKSLMEKPLVKHISIFHNFGFVAGASVSHPHSQIITVPLLDQDFKNALLKSEQYYQENKRCLTCDMNAAEERAGKRIFFENDNFIAFCPFASKTAFQIIISPKKHLSYFEKINEKEKSDLAKIFKVIFKKINKVLSGPAFNFYLHTSPCDGNIYDYYHWHWTILPRIKFPAGFELGTHINVSIVKPENSAQQLRKIEVPAAEPQGILPGK